MIPLIRLVYPVDLCNVEEEINSNPNKTRVLTYGYEVRDLNLRRELIEMRSFECSG
jgi:hypothetical protein